MFFKKNWISVLLCTTVLFSGCSFRNTDSDEFEDALQEEPVYSELSPAFTETSDPANWNVKWEIFENDTAVEKITRDEKISFPNAQEYFPFEGISTFRGNNYRNDPTYGYADITEEELEVKWSHTIGSLDKWSGCGWTGQPLIVRWEEETKQLMDIFPRKKEKEDLVEVIYATLDGNIYFYDLEDGEPTRNPLKVGMTFKGTGTLDPRGYPIMYIGSGIAINGKSQRMFAINLIDNSVIFEYSGVDSKAYRNWAAFDSSPMIDADTDTLVWPGENGVLYTMKLNTDYNPSEGTISIDPGDIAKCRYQTSLTSKGRWVGYEGSCVVVGGHAFIAENSGMLFCVDLNTMELVWAQDVVDDTNSSPAFDWEEDGSGSVYIAPALRWTAKGTKGNTTIFKMDAGSGKVLWKNTYDCVRRSDDSSGGVQASPAIGRKGTDMEDIIIYAIASTPSQYQGLLLAFDKKTGDVVWEQKMPNYTWSSPAIVYTANGIGYVVVCDSAGKVQLLRGSTGEAITSINVGSNVESSPAIFENTLVVGTRGCKIYGIDLK